uniref:EF-hand domain-containing protein n=1 Tax=Chrysotila carterae TaxID=13221 RepID=A0A7S4B2B9_CHRCT
MRSCETTHLPLDDREVRAAIRKCVPDAHGKIGIEQFVQTLKMRWTPSEPKPSKGGERIWELQGGPEPITKMLRPVLPAHAYKASDLPPSPTKKVAKWNDNQEEAQPWHCRNAYEMLTAGAQPQAPHPAEMQRRLLADPNRSGDDQLNALRLALQQYDRTRCGVLPATTVTQYAQLHRINKAHSPAWESILFSCEAPGMRGRIDYRKLLEKLQNK